MEIEVNFNYESIEERILRLKKLTEKKYPVEKQKENIETFREKRVLSTNRDLNLDLQFMNTARSPRNV